MSKTVKQMLQEANAAVERITPARAQELMAGDDVLIVDVRDAPEVAATGKIKGAVNISRGMLEFRADENTPFHEPAMQKDNTIMLYCASGGRSALSAKLLKDMGYSSVYNLGAFKDWAEAGFATEPA